MGVGLHKMAILCEHKMVSDEMPSMPGYLNPSPSLSTITQALEPDLTPTLARVA